MEGLKVEGYGLYRNERPCVSAVGRFWRAGRRGRGPGHLLERQHRVRQVVRSPPAPSLKVGLDLLIPSLRRWCCCIIVGPGHAERWDLDPRFGEIIKKYTDSLNDRAAPRADPSRVYTTFGKHGHMHFDRYLQWSLQIRR